MSKKFEHGHALVIGVGADLKNTAQDAVGLAETLKDPERCAYLHKQVHVLTEQEATRVNILHKLKQLAQEASSDSTVIFYFSGHGYQITSSIGQVYYLMPFGYDANQLYLTAINGTELADHLRAIPAQKMLILLDCCHAGGLDTAKSPGMELAKAPLPPEARSLMAQGRGRVIIASSEAQELSYAGKPYSAFTLALLEALAGKGASQSDGYVRVADLALHAREMVPKRTKNKQHPILNFEQADNFVVAYYAGGDTQAKGLPFKEEEVEIEPEPGAFAVFNQQGQIVHGPQTNIGTAQGPVFSGNIQGPVSIGRTEIVHGDKISGDKIGGDKIGGDKIEVGNITGSQGIAIGRGARASVNTGGPTADMDKLFAPLVSLAQAASASQRDAALQAVQSLKDEAAKGNRADDSRLGKLIDKLVDLVPGAVSAVVSTFASPVLGGLVGPVTQFVLDKIQDK